MALKQSSIDDIKIEYILNNGNMYGDSGILDSVAMMLHKLKKFPNYIAVRDRDNLPYEKISNAIEAPFFVYRGEEIRKNLEKLKEHIHKDINIFYSLKANPNKTLVQFLHSLGTGCEVCSIIELETCLSAGISPNSIIFAGPAKSTKELQHCINIGIKAIIVESFDEIKLLNTLCEKSQKIQNIAIRINPNFHSKNSKLNMTGKSSQFGIEEDIIFGVLEEISHLLIPINKNTHILK